MMSFLNALALGCASALLVLPAAHAAEKKEPAAAKKTAPAAAKPKEAPAAKPKAPILSQAELRECFAQRDRIRAQHEETLRMKEQIGKDKDDIIKLGDTLKEKLATLDRTSAEAVAAYNAETAAREKQIDTYEVSTKAFNAKVDALAAERDSFTKNCENKRFDEADEQAIKRGK